MSPNFEELFEQMTDQERDNGEQLQRDLQSFFMNPMKKWKLRCQFPWKFALQFLKILFVTAQLYYFANLRMTHVDFLKETTTVMRHKFLRNWTDDRDALQYPPAEGRYAVYDAKGIFDHLSHIVKAYYGIQTESFTSFSYDLIHPNRRMAKNTNPNLQAGVTFDNIPFMEMCIDRIANVTVQNATYEFDINGMHEYLKLNFTFAEVENITSTNDAIEKILEKRSITFHADDVLRLSKATININLRTIHFSPVAGDRRPECYLIKLGITFDNSMHTGMVRILLSTMISYVQTCNGRVVRGDFIKYDTIFMVTLDVLVLVLSLFSFVLCARALMKAHLLKNDFDSCLFTLTGIFLGTGLLLVYAGVLRYFAFFEQFNVLILTMKKAAPSILGFLVCTTVLYCGFLIAGWIIIGPYSMKTFGRVYIYVFVVLFSIVVLSLFIAIIEDARKVVKDRHSECSLLKDFIDASSPASQTA